MGWNRWGQNTSAPKADSSIGRPHHSRKVLHESDEDKTRRALRDRLPWWHFTGVVGLGGDARRRSDSGGFLALRRLPFDTSGPEQDRPVAGRRVRQTKRLGPRIQLFRGPEKRAPDLGAADARQAPAEPRRGCPRHEDV